MKQFEFSNNYIYYKGALIGEIEKELPFKIKLLVSSKRAGDFWIPLVLTFPTIDKCQAHLNKNFLLFFKHYKFPNVKERDVNEIIEDIKANFPNCCVYDSLVDGPEDKKKDIPTIKPKSVSKGPKSTDHNERTKIGKNYQRLGYAETDDHDAVIYSINDYLYARDGATAKKDPEPLTDTLVGYLRVNKIGNKFVQVKKKDHARTT